MCIRDRKKAQDRAHILEGLRKAVDIVDEIIATIRACKGGFAEAKACLLYTSCATPSAKRCCLRSTAP